MPEMVANIQSNQMVVKKEEARPGPYQETLPQERHFFRIPEFPPIPQCLYQQPLKFTVSLKLFRAMFEGLKHFKVESIEIYQYWSKNWYRDAKEEEWEIFSSLWQGPMNSCLHIKSFMGQEKTIELLEGWSPLSCKYKFKKMKNWLKNKSLLSLEKKREFGISQALEKEVPLASNRSKPATKIPKDRPKGPQKKMKVPGTIKERGKLKQIGTGSPNWSLQPWTVCSIWQELL
ncbi:hypothetical protein O181_003127 [Austropuccinia psidii MF-1]|uniref:Uncharacterized protein n=1 Tax=Austropuccinia psidii MF-1 TaxID=1389203 RepID=A0A9Q3BE53_9BASI|nr:hypothetical protein [Austropuccinia psidii MF-1]